MTQDKLLTSTEVAEWLGVKPSWVEEHARQGDLTSVQLGRYRRFRRADVEDFIERCSTGDVAIRRHLRVV